MSTSVASDFDTMRASRGGGAGKIAIFAAKLLVTGACFWYLSRQINLGQVISAVPLLDFRWAAFAVLVVMLEIPLAGLRWSAIVDALAARDERVTRTVMIGVTAIGYSSLRCCRAWQVTAYGPGCSLDAAVTGATP